LNNNKLINEKLICAFRWSVLPSIMKMLSFDQINMFYVLVLTFVLYSLYAHNFEIINYSVEPKLKAEIHTYVLLTFTLCSHSYSFVLGSTVMVIRIVIIIGVVTTARFVRCYIVTF